MAGADATLGSLEGGLLPADLVVAPLDSPGPQRFARHRSPYLHPLAAWRAGLAGQSFMGTSGTGPGTTECFMVPMLPELLRQA